MTDNPPQPEALSGGAGQRVRPAPARTRAELLQRLAALGIPYTLHEHPAVFTVTDAQRLRGALPGAHCKSLFLKDKRGKFYLLVCLEDRRIDMKALAGLIGSARLSFAKPPLMAERLGVEPGSVTPFAIINDDAEQGREVDIILDAEMMQASLVNYHPLINTATIAVTPADLIRFLEACHHAPRCLDLAAATQESST